MTRDPWTVNLGPWTVNRGPWILNLGPWPFTKLLTFLWRVVHTTRMVVFRFSWKKA